MSLLFRSGRHVLQLGSWHEFFEAEPGVEIRSCAVTFSNGIGLAVFRGAPEDFERYRSVWARLRELAAALASDLSKPAEGTLVMEHGVLSWRTTN
jgi:hypothetical protein